MTPPSDADLVRRFRAGEARAFETLVDRYKRPIFVLVSRLVGDSHAAEDVLQDCFVRLWRRLDEIDETRPLYGYLRRMAVNLSLNHIRGRSRRSRATGAMALERSHEPAPGASLDTADETAMAVRESLEKLPGDQRTCLVLRVQEEMSYAEIASATGVRVGTVMSRLSRARLALRKTLRERAVL